MKYVVDNCKDTLAVYLFSILIKESYVGGDSTLVMRLKIMNLQKNQLGDNKTTKKFRDLPTPIKQTKH